VVCYDLETGRPRWVHADPARYDSNLAGVGPRATPTLDGKRLYAVGATGILNCLDLATGRRIWSTNFVEANQATLNSWGVSGSPLVLERLVVVSAGGRDGRSLVAYDKATGTFAWGGGKDRAGYSSPGLVTLQGTPQILIFNAGTVAAHDPATGAVLWDYPWPKSHPHVAMPVVLPGDQLLISSGYGTGCERVQVATNAEGKFSAARIWKSNRMKAKFTNLVYKDGHVYGLDDGILACIDVAHGERQWKDGRYGHGQVILVGDLLLVMGENGELALVEPVPDAHRELTRFQALEGKVWNAPALAGDRLLVRNDQEAACYRLGIARGFPGAQ
jgi:outer membrane protein assembly factor BamB